MKILAIDPGYEKVGIAIVGKKLFYSDCFKTKNSLPFEERLLKIGIEIEKIIKKYKPNTLAIEKLYFNSNQKTAMGVSEARGVIIYTAIKNNLKVFEYTPAQIKVATTGYGRATKRMVMDIIPKLIEVKKHINSDDEFDAIAVGITCLAHEK
ncbi:MAG: crossover junction endodeoxyribonuclease RuvC [Patescibacteria group bacterium]|nr:crossover junction endodeoxyribonuclease RuvC [Patescibacteria group bacterium]